MKSITRSIYAILAAASIAIGLSACGGGGGGAGGNSGIPLQKTTPFTVGGYVGGLAAGAQVTLLDNGGDTLTVTANGAFTFATAIPANGSYSVTVGTQPAGQTCSVTGGSGNGATTNNYNVTSVRVSCTAQSKYAYVASSSGVSQYTISGGALTPMGTATVPAGSAPSAVTTHPSGQYAYVANNVSNNISQYNIGSGGALTPMTTATVPAGTAPVAITVDPTGRYAYAVNFGSGGGAGSVSQYNVTAGALVPMAVASVTADVGSNFITVDPSGKYVYVSNNGTGNAGTISQYAIGANGELAPMSPATVSIGGSGSLAAVSVAVSPDGKYAYGLTSADIAQYSISTTGALTYMGSGFVPAFPAGSNVGGNALSIDSFGVNMYTTNTTSGFTGAGVNLITINSNGNLKMEGSVTAGKDPVTTVIDPTGTFAFVVNSGDSTISQYTINSGSGMPGSLIPQTPATVTTGASPNSIALAP